MDHYEDILTFWFGDIGEDGQSPADRRQMWWRKSEETDQRCRAAFAEALAAAKDGAREAWLDSPRSCLALVILCDQFSRNIFRGTPESFAADAQARRATHHALAHGFDAALRPIERAFLLMPLMHAEDLAEQEEAVRRFEVLAGEGADFAGFARQHRDIVARFGRFPHRNQILGRQSTAEEVEFLAQPGSSF